MPVQHRFECVTCGHRIRTTGEDSETARQHARERGAAHVNDAHADRLADSTRWPDELASDDLLVGEAAYGGLHGWLAPVDDLLVCADCGYYFGRPESPDDRRPVGEAGLVCLACHDRRVDDRSDSIERATDAFFR
ncbi:hypothetical protein NGM10_04800 [Halorussus salilacus]|uniref:hypothetical protein n=1 Tax=Halorussus salilacus TaxID=2953750 RepID=UPI00209EC0CF|nr:hypothetical protein [Halorussus salilacus]USZ69057.1 hypothetical protein NGM10_04800 [Halorussus salilacus]